MQIWYCDSPDKWPLVKTNFSGSQWRICYGTATYLICPQEMFFAEMEDANREVGEMWRGEE